MLPGEFVGILVTPRLCTIWNARRKKPEIEGFVNLPLPFMDLDAYRVFDFIGTIKRGLQPTTPLYPFVLFEVFSLESLFLALGFQPMLSEAGPSLGIEVIVCFDNLIASTTLRSGTFATQ